MRTEKIRISADPSDKGYRCDFWRFAVFLDGQPVELVQMADEETGEIRLKIAGETIILKGQVEIKKLPDDFRDRVSQLAEEQQISHHRAAVITRDKFFAGCNNPEPSCQSS